MRGGMLDRRLLVVVGAGGVGKTTLAAGLGLHAARRGHRTLVMTFDPSLRLKDALGVGEAALDRAVEVRADTPARLDVILLDARQTFDRLIARYAPDQAAADRIYGNRFYRELAGNLAGILEYMAVERLFEVAAAREYDRIVLDTPPTRQALDFLEAPSRIVGFLDSGALRIALKPWFDESGHLRPTRRLGPLGRGVEAFFDRLVGLGLLRDMAEFFQAFGPLFDGFRARAVEVQALLRAPTTQFVLVTRPDEERVPETLFFARRLVQAGHRLAAVVVNMVHPAGGGTSGVAPDARDGRGLLAWLGHLDARGVGTYRARLPQHPLIDLPLLADEPSDLEGLAEVRALVEPRWLAAFGTVARAGE